MALQGSLSGFDLRDIMRMVAQTSKSGTLSVGGNGSEGRVCFHEGRVYYAATSNNGAPLGARLADASLISQDDLREALHRQADEDEARRLGEILVEDGCISRPELEEFVRHQIEDSLFEMLSCSDGEYHFDPESEAAEDIVVCLEVEDAIREAERRLEEWARITEIIPTPDVAVALSSEPASRTVPVSVEPEEWGVALLLKEPLTVEDVRVATGQTLLGIGRILYRMVSKSLVDVTVDPPPAGESEDSPADAQNQEGSTSGLETDGAVPSGSGTVQEGREEADGTSDEDPDDEGSPSKDAGPAAEGGDEAESENDEEPENGDQPESNNAEDPGAGGDPEGCEDVSRKYILPRNACEAKSGFPAEWERYYDRLEQRRALGRGEIGSTGPQVVEVVM